MTKKILIIAGEASGDKHAGSLVKEIKKLNSDIIFYGLGGANMKDAGVNIFYDILNLAAIGPIDALKNYSQLKNIYLDMRARIKKDKFDCAILIDYPEFNLEIAKELKNLKIPVIYYISPQVWAWRKNRIKKIKKFIDKMLVFFDFEKDLYQKENISAEFVGHPLLDYVKQTQGESEIKRRLGIGTDKIIIGILPGSRKNEITRILPVMAKSAQLIADNLGKNNIEFILLMAQNQEKPFIQDILNNARCGFSIKFIENDAYNALSVCRAAMVASGTATLETAILGIPMAIVYKVNMAAYLLLRPLIRIPYIGLVNIVAGEKIVPEFIQGKARAALIAEYLLKLLKNDTLCRKKAQQLINLKSKLGAPGASARAAVEVIKFLQNR